VGFERARAFEQEHAVGDKVGSAAQATLGRPNPNPRQATLGLTNPNPNPNPITTNQATLGRAQQLDAEYKIAENAGAAARAVGQVRRETVGLRER